MSIWKVANILTFVSKIYQNNTVYVFDDAMELKTFMNIQQKDISKISNNKSSKTDILRKKKFVTNHRYSFDLGENKTWNYIEDPLDFKQHTEYCIKSFAPKNVLTLNHKQFLIHTTSSLCATGLKFNLIDLKIGEDGVYTMITDTVRGRALEPVKARKTPYSVMTKKPDVSNEFQQWKLTKADIPEHYQSTKYPATLFAGYFEVQHVKTGLYLQISKNEEKLRILVGPRSKKDVQMFEFLSLS